MRGGARGDRARKIGRWLQKANKWLRKTKLASRAGRWYGQTKLPYAAQAAQAGEVAAQLGYGLRLPGGKRRTVRRRRRVR